MFHFESKVYLNNPLVKFSFIEKYAVILTIIALFLVPLAGLIADVYFGRYKIIKCSLWIMWCIIIVHVVVMILNHTFLEKFRHIFYGVYAVFIVLIVISWTGFQANIIQLGIDQLYDSSSQEIVAYIVSYVWTFSASEVMIQLTQICICDEYQIVATLLLPLLLTLAVSTDSLFNYHLIKEPGTHNPLKLVAKVLRYAWKNKYPRQRSAFTYWDDKRYTRIDLAKSKYGGPFTTEQVEDVKTFFRLLTVVSVTSLSIGVFLHGADLITGLNIQFQKNSFLNCSQMTKNIRRCFKRLVFSNAGEIFVTVFLPVHQFAFLPLPLVWKYLSSIGSLKKCGVGICMLFLCVFGLLLIQLYRDIHGHHSNHFNQSTTICTLKDNSELAFTKWIAIPGIIASIGETLLLIGCIEFICAQSPYSMKGLLFGFVYVGIGVSLVSIKILTALFSNVISWRRLVLDCIFWYLLVCTIIAVLLFTVFLGISVWYKRRERDDNLPNQHYFAEQYYGNRIENSEENLVQY